MKAHGFRVCFTPLLEVLFTFPSRYLSTIGLSVVFSLAGWAPQIPAELLVLRGTQVPACLLIVVSRTGLSPSTDQLSRWFRYSDDGGAAPVLQPRARPQDRPGLGYCAFARHYLRNHCYFLFLWVLRCFSSPGSPPHSIYAGDGLAPAGFPHSDIRGSQGICPSPRLFAACHVLLRLREPKASPMRPRFAFLSPHDAGAAVSSPWTLLCTCFRPVCPAAHGLTKVSVILFSLDCFETASKFVSRSQHVNERVSSGGE